VSWRRGINPNFQRRAFLAGLGATALAPFIPLLNASGQEASFPKRLILFYTPHGTIMDQWLPMGTETDFTLGPLLAPLAPFQKKINVLAGVGMHDEGVGAPHTKGLPLLWTGSNLLQDMTFTRADGTGGKYFGWNSSASVDQVIAKSIGGMTAHPSLEFGVRCDGAFTGQPSTVGSQPATRMIYADAKQPLPPEVDPWAAFTRLFGGHTDAVGLERKSALDLIQAELGDLGTRVAKEDQAKIAAHLDAIRATELQLAKAASACNGPVLQAQVDPNQQSNTPLIFDSQLDLLTSVLSCDVTRVASLQYTIGDIDNTVYSWLGISNAFHDMTHAPDNDATSRASLLKIYTWFAQRFAYLLAKLDSIPEGNGTLLDNCLVVWGSEIGKGNTHALAPTPFITAGGAGGAVKTGRFLRYSTAAPADYGASQAAFPESSYHNRLLVSICHAMGVSDVNTFGNTDKGSGPLDQLAS
jgi:hypothetical protein